MHLDWQIARGESVKDIQILGREIERMDTEMEKIQQEIGMLEKGRWNVNALIPMSEVKTGRMCNNGVEKIRLVWGYWSESSK